MKITRPILAEILTYTGSLEGMVKRSGLASLKITFVISRQSPSVWTSLTHQVWSLSPSRNWGNIMYKTMGIASQRTPWRTQVKGNFLLNGENHILLASSLSWRQSHDVIIWRLYQRREGKQSMFMGTTSLKGCQNNSYHFHSLVLLKSKMEKSEISVKEKQHRTWKSAKNLQFTENW